MRIAVVGPQFPDSFAHNVKSTLEQMAHHVVTAEGRSYKHNQNRYAAAARRYLPKVVPALEARMHASMLATIRDLRPDLVLVTYDLFGPTVVKALKQAAGCPVVCWFIDAPANLRGGSLFLCDYDAFFVKEPHLSETMKRKLGLPAHYLPEACNPQWHKPVVPTAQQLAEFACDVTAQGSPHPYRAKFFEGLLDFDVKIWGNALPSSLQSPSRKFFQGRFIACEEKAAAFSSAKILVNSMHFVEQSGVNNTLFEAAGCGAFQICDARPTLHEFFAVDKEVVTFASRDELREKIRYYLPREEERKAMGGRASDRAHREHSYEARLQSMLRTIGL